MLDIKIDDDYKLTSDERQVFLVKKRIITGENVKGKKVNPDNIGKINWDEIGSYHNVRSALDGYVKVKVLKSNVKSFDKLFELYDSIKKTIDGIKDIDNLFGLKGNEIVKIKSNKKVTK